MLVKEAKALARQWVSDEGSSLPGFRGAFFHGSTNWLPDETALPATSDVDVMVVLSDSDPPVKLGKFIYHGVLLEISYLPLQDIESPEIVLGNYHLAGSFRAPGIISDPLGQLATLQAAVSQGYAKRQWVRRRCEHARSNILRNLRSLNEAQPFHDQVTSWLFGTGVTTHILLVAGLRNPTVRQRYLAVRELLSDFNQLDAYEPLLRLLGCAEMSQARVQRHLQPLAEIFDAAKEVIKTPFFFASDISDQARPIAIDGSQRMIERGDHREAIFWMVATWCRCLKILYHDAPVELQNHFREPFVDMMHDLGITSFADLRKGAEQVEQSLPAIWEVAEAIMLANQEIQDD